MKVQGEGNRKETHWHEGYENQGSGGASVMCGSEKTVNIKSQPSGVERAPAMNPRPR